MKSKFFFGENKSNNQKKQKLKPKSQDQGFLGVGYEVLYSLLMPMNGTFNFTFIKKK